MPFNIIIPSTSWLASQKIRSGETIAIFFHQTGCGHCDYALEQLGQVMSDVPVLVHSINTTHDHALAAEVGIDGTPTMILYSEGAVVGKLDGSQDAETYLKFLSGGEGEEEGEEEEEEGEEEDGDEEEPSEPEEL